MNAVNDTLQQNINFYYFSRLTKDPWAASRRLIRYNDIRIFRFFKPCKPTPTIPDKAPTPKHTFLKVKTKTTSEFSL